MAQISYGTITITDTNDIESITIEYARNQSTSSPPDATTGGWSTTRPAWAQGYYIWQRARIHKSGTETSADTFGAAVCLTGSAGQTGAAGRSLTSTTTEYTTAAENIIINENNMGNYTWSSDVPAYSSSKPIYWVRVTNIYSNPSSTEYIIYKDNGITDAVATSVEANELATEAIALAQNTNYAWWSLAEPKTVGQNTFAAGSYGTFIRSTDFQTNPTNQPNIFMDANGIHLRKALVDLASFTGTALTFNKPSNNNKAMELSSSGLTFYDGSAANGGNIQAQFGSSGAIQSGDYTINAATDKFSTYGTKIDLVHGEIYSPYFRLSQGSVSGGPVAGIYMSGTFESTGALIGYQKTSNSDTNAYWKLGYMTDTNQDKLTYQRADSIGFIELAPSSTFIIQKNKIHTAWFGNNGYLTYPQLDSKYYDFGINLPTSLDDKFLYIRYNSGSNLSTIYQNDSNWIYPFYIDGTGNINTTGSIDAHDIKIDGISIAGGSLVAGSLSSYGGSSNRPVYFPSSGANQGKPIQITVTDNTSSTAVSSTDSNLITARTLYYAGYVKSSGITSVTVAATSPVVSSTNTAQTGSSASTTISLADAYGDTKNPYGTKTKNYVLAGPTTGSAAVPTFRALVKEDIPDLSSIYLTSYTETDPVFTASAASGISSSDITNWNNKTSNIGTVTQISTGVGLTGGDITSTGTIKANLTSDTKLTNAALSVTEDSTRIYPVRIDKNSKMVVVVPWTNVNSSYLTSSSTLNWNNVITNRPTTLGGYGITDAKIANGVVTLGSNTISKMPNPNALTIKVYNANTATPSGSTYSPTEVSYDGSTSGNTALVAGTNAITSISANDASGGSSTFTVIKADGTSSTFNVNISGAVVSGATILTDEDGVGLDVAGPVYFDDGLPKSMKPSTSNNLFLKDDGTWATPIGTTYVFDGTYNASSNKAATVSTVTNAINALDGGTIGTPGTGKTITAISQTNGNISVTFGNISITKSQISDFPSEMTPASHTHGNISNDGKITSTIVSVANNDTLLFADNSNGGKIERLGAFDGSTTTQALSKKGTWETFSKFSGSYNDLTNKPTIPVLPTNIVNTITTTAGAHTEITNQTGDVNFNIPTTPAHIGIKFGYTTSGNNRAVQQDSSGNLYVEQKDNNTNYYHTSGSWGSTNNLTYTATANGGAGALAFTLPTASTSVYGATKLSSISSSTEQGLAATPKLVYDSINSAAGNYVAKSGDTMTGSLTTPELIASKITAEDVNVSHLLTAEGIQTKNWTAVNMATIDGSFYIVPTVTAATASVKYTTNGTLEFTATGTSTFATNSLFIDGNATNWTQNSLIMITGLIHIGDEDISIGTLKGTLTAVNPTNKTLTLGGTITSSTGTNTPAILSLLTANTTYSCKDIKVSIYSYYNNGHDNLLGIMMTTAGTKNRTYIDIYDGTHQTNAESDAQDSSTKYTKPVVRIGNLRGLPVMANGDAPTGWGIYTTNGFFNGIISATRGHIGAAASNKIIISGDISNAAIYSGSHSTLSSSDAGFYIGTNGISIGSRFNYNENTNTLTLDTITATNFNLNTGQIASSVTIGGTAASTVLTNISNAQTSANNASYLVEIEVRNIDYTTSTATLFAHVYYKGAELTSSTTPSISTISFQWKKVVESSGVYTVTDISGATNQSLVTTDLDTTYVCVISSSN